MLRIPENFVHTRSTPFWNKETAPKALLPITTPKPACTVGYPSCRVQCVTLALPMATPPNPIWKWSLRPVLLASPHPKNGTALSY